MSIYSISDWYLAPTLASIREIFYQVIYKAGCVDVMVFNKHLVFFSSSASSPFHLSPKTSLYSKLNHPPYPQYGSNLFGSGLTFYTPANYSKTANIRHRILHQPPPPTATMDYSTDINMNYIPGACDGAKESTTMMESWNERSMVEILASGGYEEELVAFMEAAKGVCKNGTQSGSNGNGTSNSGNQGGKLSAFEDSSKDVDTKGFGNGGDEGPNVSVSINFEKDLDNDRSPNGSGQSGEPSAFIDSLKQGDMNIPEYVNDETADGFNSDGDKDSDIHSDLLDNLDLDAIDFENYDFNLDALDSLDSNSRDKKDNSATSSQFTDESSSSTFHERPGLIKPSTTRASSPTRIHPDSVYSSLSEANFHIAKLMPNLKLLSYDSIPKHFLTFHSGYVKAPVSLRSFPLSQFLSYVQLELTPN